MAGNPLAKFFATVGFKADTSELDATIKRVKQELQNITGNVKSSSAYKKAKQAEAKDFNNHIYAYKKHMIGVNKQIQKNSEKTLESLGIKRKAQMQEEASKQKELVKMGDFYRKQEAQQLKKEVKEKQGLEKLHAQALRDNIAYDKRKERAMWKEAQFLNREYNLKEKNRKAEEASQKRVQEKQQRFAERLKLAEIRARTREMAIASRERIASLNAFSPASTGAVGGLTAKGAVGSLATGGFTMSSYKVGQFSASRLPQFEFLTGSAEEARNQIKFLDAEVERLGLNLIESNEQYKGLLSAGATSIGVKKTQELFTGFSELAVMLGLSGDAQKRALNAFGQMMSKNQVYAEELKGQLNEALKGSTQIFADAITGGGVKGQGDVAKLFDMMEKGLVGNKELVKVIDYMKTLTPKDLVEAQANTVARKFERMRNQWVYFLEQTNEAGVLDVMITAFEEATDLMRSASQWLKANQKEFDKFAESVKYYYRMFKDLLGVIIDHWQIVLSIFVANKIVKALYTMSTAATVAGGSFLLAARAVGAFLMRALVIPTLVAAIILAVEDLVGALSGKDSLFVHLAKSDNPLISFLSKAVLLLSEMIRLAWTFSKTGIMRKVGVLTGDKSMSSEAILEQQAELENAKNLLNFILGNTSDFKAVSGNVQDYVNSKTADVLSQNMIPFSTGQRVPSAKNGWGTGPQNNYVTVTVNNPTKDVDVISAISTAMNDMLKKDMTNYGAMQ